jgi:hypothetical protein
LSSHLFIVLVLLCAGDIRTMMHLVKAGLKAAAAVVVAVAAKSFMD